jgi:hypothetical protein
MMINKVLLILSLLSVNVFSAKSILTEEQYKGLLESGRKIQESFADKIFQFKTVLQILFVYDVKEIIENEMSTYNSRRLDILCYERGLKKRFEVLTPLTKLEKLDQQIKDNITKLNSLCEKGTGSVDETGFLEHLNNLETVFDFYSKIIIADKFDKKDDLKEFVLSILDFATDEMSFVLIGNTYLDDNYEKFREKFGRFTWIRNITMKLFDEEFNLSKTESLNNFLEKLAFFRKFNDLKKKNHDLENKKD